jgi:hypothetical protein
MLAAEARAAAFAQLHPPTVFALADPSKIFGQSVGRLADAEISRNAREGYALSADGIFNRPSRRVQPRAINGHPLQYLFELIEKVLESRAASLRQYDLHHRGGGEGGAKSGLFRARQGADPRGIWH